MKNEKKIISKDGNPMNAKGINEAKKFIKKPIEVEAIQFTNENKDRVYGWAKQIQQNIEHAWDEDKNPTLIIPTLGGEMICAFGDYLIKEPFPTDWRKIYPCKPDIFEATYAQRESGESETLLKKLNEALLPENVECDGAGCMGCWKDKVREAINLIKANNFLSGSADSQSGESKPLGEGERVSIDEQKVLDALRFTWRNLNWLKEVTEKQVSRRMRNSMNFKIRKVMDFVEEALTEFAVKNKSETTIPTDAVSREELLKWVDEIPLKKKGGRLTCYQKGFGFAVKKFKDKLLSLSKK